MKKLITLISVASLFALPFVGNGQSIKLVVPSAHLISDTSTAIDASVYMVNTGSSAITIKVTRRVISLTSGHANQVCWGGFCDSPGISTSSNSETINPGDTSKDFTGNVLPYDIIGNDTVNYLFFDLNDASDTASTTLTYNFTAIAGINELNDFAGSTFNCSQSNSENATNISYSINNFKDGKIVIRNIVGATVKEIKLTDKQGFLSVPNYGMPAGIYIYCLYNSGEAVAARKAIIYRN